MLGVAKETLITIFLGLDFDYRAVSDLWYFPVQFQVMHYSRITFPIQMYS